MRPGSLCLGIDLSTQSVTASLVDAASGGVVLGHSLNYAEDPRLNRFGIDRDTYLVPPRSPGEADQNPLMFLAALDALFSDLKGKTDLSKVVGIACSAQQHGHVYLRKSWETAVAALKAPGAGASASLSERMAGTFSLGTSPIWKTSDTAAEAAHILEAAGGRAAMIRASGSDSPLRFTGAVVRRIGLRYPELFAVTEAVRLLSAWLAAILSGEPSAPSDWGNAAGMSLMDYSKKEWSEALLSGCADGLPGGVSGLRSKLGPLGSPLAMVGTAAAYFRERYGLPADAAVFSGSGDNPQTKVLAEGDLLSLGTSFVTMVSTDGAVDPEGAFNAMYDGLGRPFMFGCRTNGALVWDRVRAEYGHAKGDYAAADSSLASNAPGSCLAIWQPDTESFPRSKSFTLSRPDGVAPSLAFDFAGVIDSSLALVYLGSGAYSAGTGAPLCVTGGPTGSKPILQRIAAIWNRPVKPIGKAGAAVGAACAAAVGLGASRSLIDACLGSVPAVEPDKKAAEALRTPGGYFDKLKDSFRKLTSA
jgi:xylulokinase